MKRIKYNLIYSLIFAICIIAPDFILQKFGVNDMAKFDILFTFAMIVFGSVIATVRQKWFFYIVILLIIIMETIQLSHICYFGTPISPIDLGKILTYSTSVAETGLIELDNFYFLPIILVFCYGIIIYFFNRWNNKFYKNRYAPLIIIAFLSIKPARALYRDTRFFFPSPIRTSLHNSINCFSCFAVKSILNMDTKVKKINYKPYKLIDQRKAGTKNIILVMGETLTREHMSLYEYKRKTTPKLDSLKTEPNFIFKDCISASVTTMVTLPLFFNCIREPLNIDELNKKNFSIFKLAKQRAFKTFFYSAQVAGILYGTTTKYVDEIIVNESTKKIDFAIKKDDHLIELFDKAKLGEKNLFIINPKSIHSPYSEHYESKPQFNIYATDKGADRKTRSVNDYDNAMTCHDDWLFRLITHVKKRLAGPTYIIITGDHGELFDNNLLYGHNHLLPETTKVPFIVYAIDGDDKIIKKLNEKEIYSHWDVARFITNLLGYDIDNPNQDKAKEEFFINGSNLYQPYYIKYKINNRTGKIQYSKPILE